MHLDIRGRERHRETKLKNVRGQIRNEQKANSGRKVEPEVTLVHRVLEGGEGRGGGGGAYGEIRR